MKDAEPISTHIKPAIACAALIVFGLAYSWALPFIHVSCIRHGERVECQVQRKMIGLISYETTTIDDLKAASLYFEHGKINSSGTDSTDTCYLMLIDAEGVKNKFTLEGGSKMGMTRSETFVNGIESFRHTDEPTFSNWTVPLIGYGAIVPFALGLLFLGLVTWDFVGTQWKALRPTDTSIDSTDISQR
jgi:hypothetical protein